MTSFHTPALNESVDEITNFEFVVEGILLMAVSLFGLISNVVSIVILSRLPMRGSFSALLIGKRKKEHPFPPHSSSC